MPDISQPGGTPGAAGGGTPPAAGNAGGLISQGPNDPINPQGGTPAGGGAQQPGTGGADDPTEKRFKNLEDQLTRFRTERDQAVTALEEEKRKGLPPEELARLKQQDEAAKAAETRIRNLTLRYEVANRAARLGIVDPELAVLLLDGNQSITISEAGVVAGLDEALKALIKERPYLVRSAPSVDAGAGAGGSRTGGKVTMNDIIRNAARGRSVTTEQ